MQLRIADRLMAAVLAASVAGIASAHEVAATRADFVPPPVGSYRLERILEAPDAKLVDAAGRPQSLAKLTRGPVTLLSLMYTQCSDEKGCPLALFTLDLVRRDLRRLPETKGKVRFVSLSFDPDRDTPAVMRDYAGDRAKPVADVPWAFVAPASRGELDRVLDGFEQDVTRAATGDSRELSHVLKVFLVDGRGWVREIYSTSFLVPRVVVNDIRTLLRERGAGR